jgi:hypothetical protein
MDHYAVLARLVSAILSWLDSANLRNQMYAQRERIEILETALDDIDRVNSRAKVPDAIISNIVQATKRHDH